MKSEAKKEILFPRNKKCMKHEKDKQKQAKK